jgi:hypothetical protein
MEEIESKRVFNYDSRRGRNVGKPIKYFTKEINVKGTGHKADDDVEYQELLYARLRKIAL